MSRPQITLLGLCNDSSQASAKHTTSKHAPIKFPLVTRDGLQQPWIGAAWFAIHGVVCAARDSSQHPLQSSAAAAAAAAADNDDDDNDSQLHISDVTWPCSTHA
jgi:hypothetical protein